ncbi:MAG: leucine-rich repeat domain-containing protein [Lachnospiraceae bacterium]|nr:leucine-rich repeat domain-containing protein [Lachnospiraceae bacterium]
MTEEAAEPESGEKESIPGSGEGAQESDGEKNAVDPAVKKTEDTEEPGEMKKPVENPAEEGQDDVSGQESAAAEEGAGNTSSNDVQSDKPTAPQKVVRAVSAAVQEEEITPVTGEGWVIDSAGKLTIESEAGMKHWREYTEGLTNPHKNNVKAVEFNAAVTYLEDNVFNGCKNLTSITIPESVKSIEDGAFYACRSLENITIPEGVTSIGAAAFQECEKLTSIAIPNSVTNISPSTFQSCTSLTSIAIPDSVTDIWDLAFYECISLKNITIPKNAKSIKMGAFSACSGLTEITIPDSMTSIGVAAFRECSNLESVIMEGSKPPVLEEMEGITAQFTGCKFQKEGTKGIKVPTGTATTYKAEWEEWAEFITDGTDDTEDDLIVSGKGWRIDSTGKLTIDSDAGMDDWSQNGSPSHADNINSVEMNTDGSVTRIGKYAFYRSKITSIIIPDSVISIGGNAFGKCSNLTSITIPDSVTTIGGYLFVECSSLNEVTLPSGMTSIV